VVCGVAVVVRVCGGAGGVVRVRVRGVRVVVWCKWRGMAWKVCAEVRKRHMFEKACIIIWLPVPVPDLYPR